MTPADAWPFPTHEAIKTDLALELERKSKVQVFRHIRPQQIRESRWSDRREYTGQVAPRGGVVFMFEIDFDQKTLEFATAVCHSADNFDRKKGNRIALNRFQHGCTFVGNYDDTLSLVENAYKIVRDVYLDEVDVFGYNRFDVAVLGASIDEALGRGEYDIDLTTFTAQVPLVTYQEAYFLRDAVNQALKEINAARDALKAA